MTIIPLAFEVSVGHSSYSYYVTTPGIPYLLYKSGWMNNNKTTTIVLTYALLDIQIRKLATR